MRGFRKSLFIVLCCVSLFAFGQSGLLDYGPANVRLHTARIGDNAASGPADLAIGLPFAKVIYARNYLNNGNNALMSLNYIAQLPGGIHYGYNSVTIGDAWVPAVIPGDDNLIRMGDPLLRWKQVVVGSGTASAPGVSLVRRSDWYNDPANPPAGGLNQDGLAMYLAEPYWWIAPQASGAGSESDVIGKRRGVLFDLAFQSPAVHFYPGLTAGPNVNVSQVGSQAAVAWGPTPIPLVSSSVANPSVIVTSYPHNLATGNTITIAGHIGSIPDINGAHAVTVIDSKSFSIPVDVTTGGAGGSFSIASWALYPMVLRSGPGVQLKLGDNSDYADLEVRKLYLSSTLNIQAVGEHTDNADALAAGHIAGDVYRTGDLLKIVH